MGRFKTQYQHYETVFALIKNVLKPIAEHSDLGIPALPTHIAGKCGAKPKTPTLCLRVTSRCLQVVERSYSLPPKLESRDVLEAS